MRDATKDQTIKLDAAQGVAEPSKGSAQFQRASSDGSRVLFTDKQRLTPGLHRRTRTKNRRARICMSARSSKKKGKLACSLKDLTVDHNEGEHAAVQYFTPRRKRRRLRSVYLIAHGVLASNRERQRRNRSGR